MKNNITTSTSKITVRYYPKSYLLNALKKAKLPCTYKTLLKYEKMGAIKRPSAVVSGVDDRFYTEAEIKQIIKDIREWKKIMKKSKKDEKFLIKYYRGFSLTK